MRLLICLGSKQNDLTPRKAASNPFYDNAILVMQCTSICRSRQRRQRPPDSSVLPTVPKIHIYCSVLAPEHVGISFLAKAMSERKYITCLRRCMQFNFLVLHLKLFSSLLCRGSFGTSHRCTDSGRVRRHPMIFRPWAWASRSAVEPRSAAPSARD